MRHLLERALATPGFAGVMAYSLPEALWLVGHGVRDVFVAYPSVDREALAALAGEDVRVVEQIAQEVPWRPGARELLAACRELDIPQALVTMSWTELAGAVVDATEPGSFGLMVTGDVVTHGKPHPEPYLTAAAQLGVHPAACIAIEDSPTGVRSAAAAGVPTLAVPHVVEVPDIAGSVRIPTLTGVTPFDLMPLALGAVARP